LFVEISELLIGIFSVMCCTCRIWHN